MTDQQEKERSLDEIFATEGYAAARKEADRRKVIWFASAGRTRTK
jgi:hypothetical protein